MKTYYEFPESGWDKDVEIRRLALLNNELLEAIQNLLTNEHYAEAVQKAQIIVSKAMKKS